MEAKRHRSIESRKAERFGLLLKTRTYCKASKKRSWQRGPAASQQASQQATQQASQSASKPASQQASPTKHGGDDCGDVVDWEFNKYCVCGVGKGYVGNPK